MKHLVLAILLCVGAAQAADVYKWKGPDGRVHFGDKPPTDVQSERLEIRQFTGAPEVEAQPTTSAASNEVVMLSTTWCGVCKRAKAYFQSQGIAFTELDVEKSEKGRAEYKRLNGRGVPIILVGDQRMNGFSIEHFERLRNGK